VCLCVKNNLRKLQTDFDETFGGVVRDPMNNRLDFGGIFININALQDRRTYALYQMLCMHFHFLF